MIINGIAGIISQMVLMPLLARVISEEKILSIGLIFNCVHIFLYSVAWSSWDYSMEWFLIFVSGAVIWLASLSKILHELNIIVLSVMLQDSIGGQLVVPVDGGLIELFRSKHGSPGQPQDLGRNFSMQMLLERVRFTLDGYECNKIGQL